jgi:GTPase
MRVSPRSALDLDRERDEGCEEYKLKLVRPTAHRLVELTTQLGYRLGEGGGEAVYRIGFADSGRAVGLRADELDESLATLRAMCAQLGASMRILSQIPAAPDRSVATAHVRAAAPRAAVDEADIGVAFLGASQVGKSSLVGALSLGLRDNGAGAARAPVLRHAHELESGLTSSVTTRLLAAAGPGDDDDDEDDVGGGGGGATRREGALSRRAAVRLIDLCGARRFFKTTASGLARYAPAYVAVVAEASGRVSEVSAHVSEVSAHVSEGSAHVAPSVGSPSCGGGVCGGERCGAGHADAHADAALACALSARVFYLVSKADRGGAAVERAIASHARAAAAAGAQLARVRTAEEAAAAARTLGGARCETRPLLIVSAVSGEGLSVLRAFLRALPGCARWTSDEEAPALFAIEHVFAGGGAANEGGAGRLSGGGGDARAVVSGVVGGGGGGGRGARSHARVRARGDGGGDDHGDDDDDDGFFGGGALGSAAFATALHASTLAQPPPSPAAAAHAHAASATACRAAEPEPRGAAARRPHRHCDGDGDAHARAIVVSGVLVRGRLSAAAAPSTAPLLLGPDRAGRFWPVSVQRLHADGARAVGAVRAGQAASALVALPAGLAPRRGMVLAARAHGGLAARASFEAHVELLAHSAPLAVGARLRLHCLALARPVVLTALLAGELVGGARATVRIEFEAAAAKRGAATVEGGRGREAFFVPRGAPLLFWAEAARPARRRTSSPAHERGGVVGEPRAALGSRSPPRHHAVIAIGTGVVAAL